MNIDIALLQIAILFFPGIILTTILQLLKKRGESYSALQLTLYSFVFGMLVNLIIYITIFHKEIPILKYMKDNESVIDITELELLISFFVAIILGLFFSYFRNLGLIYTQLSNYDITYETGYPSLLDYTMQSPEKPFNQLDGKVRIKTLENSSATYIGKISSIEYHDEYTEILLTPDSDIENTSQAYYLNLKNGNYVIDYTVTEPISRDVSKKIYWAIALVILIIGGWNIYYYKNLQLPQVNITIQVNK